MKVAEALEPTIINLTIRSNWLRNYKGSDGDTNSEISGASALKRATHLPLGSCRTHGSIRDSASLRPELSYSRYESLLY